MPRKICEDCQRPITVCICEFMTTLTAPCDLIILQHPSEQKQALATVPILQACMTNLTVVIGEQLADESQVKALLENPEDTYVLFPAEGSDVWSMDPDPSGTKDIPAEQLQRLPKKLIVLDGTWRKAKLLWHLNPWLHKFKTISLEGMPNSEYLIRSSTVPGGVSTLEAVMHCCNYLSDSQDYLPLLLPFKAMIDWQIKKMGKETFLAHYGNTDN